MLISSKSIKAIAEKLESSASGSEIFCSGLFLSARWFAVSQLDYDGVQLYSIDTTNAAMAEYMRTLFTADEAAVLGIANVYEKWW